MSSRPTDFLIDVVKDRDAENARLRAAITDAVRLLDNLVEFDDAAALGGALAVADDLRAALEGET